MSRDLFIRSEADVLDMLDGWFRDEGAWWDGFYGRAEGAIPFMVEAPDENLCAWLSAQLPTAGRCLELGCGPGRNANFLASRGWQVHAIDLSEEALEIARARAEAAGVTVRYQRADALRAPIEEGGYELVYDAGCLHHVLPHRRPDYLRLLRRALAPEGWFGLVCFTAAGGSGLTDAQVYQERSMRGGLGFTEAQLRALFEPDFEVVELRRMRPQPPGGACYGLDILHVALMRLVSP
ncbi:MAG: methyltransferase domain-containing protein [Alphaproteobacteria bacterium]|nr:methyltransferase domain-containing protein [Alphaproteobacteria bacterium]